MALVVPLLTLLGCAQKPSALVCSIQQRTNETDLCGPTGCVLKTGVLVTITFPKGDDNQIAVGDVFGVQTILKRKELEELPPESRDPNVAQYVDSAKSPIPRDEVVLLNKISGQLYYYKKVKGEVYDQFYALCKRQQS